MLLSMTGHGEGQCQRGGVTAAVEVRAVNNRYFKLSTSTVEQLGAWESQIEAIVRRHVRRGSVHVELRVERESGDAELRLNEAVLTGYHQQLAALARKLGLSDAVRLDALVDLPGVVDERSMKKSIAESDWPAIEGALTAALEQLTRMRGEEGRAMESDLRGNCRQIGEELARIEERAPQVAEGYRGRLADRIGKLLAEHDVKVDAADLIREVGLFAERSDVSEECVRLRSHLDQFDAILNQPESNGRKLDFLTQELLREVNTIGSKANDAQIARHVVEIKSLIERIREMVQNVE